MQKWIGANGEDDCGTDDTVGFLFGFAGYEYRKCLDKDQFKEAIRASIDARKPVIARAKLDQAGGRYRVITGYDGDALIQPDYAHAKGKPEGVPSYGELEALFIIGAKIAPRYTLKDGLARIHRVMKNTMEENLWDGYLEKLGGWLMFPSGDGLEQAAPEERKARMERLTKAIWSAMSCHNFGEAFRNRNHVELQSPALSALWERISNLCYSMDALIYGIDYMKNQIDWSGIHPYTTAPGISAMLCLSIEKLKNIDAELMNVIEQAIAMMDS